MRKYFVIALLFAAVECFGQSTVNLSWQAGGGSISGYNTFRATGVCPQTTYTEINTALITGLTYVDTTATPGLTYCYVATSVGTNGQESGYSNPAEAAIPPLPPGNLQVGSIVGTEVPLNWDAPPLVAGEKVKKYLVYRGSKPTMPAPTLRATVTGLSFTDDDLTGTWYYAIAADVELNGKQVQTAKSNIVKATVPPIEAEWSGIHGDLE